ncbi:MAG: hypothetical protein A4E69_01064 [Syntrophus sp. PtaB.Bin138]|nr:MAG: hypothetical protein A4E69_01064 [Syntrophus sp. PtaB.Bin138]
MKIVNFRKIETAGILVAAFDVQFQPLIVRGITLCRKDNGETWISEPAEKFTGRDGNDAWKKHVNITDEALKSEIRRQAIALLDGEAPSSDGKCPF